MRPSVSRDLAVLVLAVAVCRAPALAGGGAKVKSSPGSAAAVSFEETGYGVTEILAKKHALEKLRVDVNDWLLDHHPDLADLHLLSQGELEGMVRKYGDAQPFKRPANKDGPDELDDAQMVQITLKAELTKSDLGALKDQARQHVAQRRQGQLGRGLLGAIAILAVGTGYLRLEEKVGRHKRKLGVAALGILGLVGLTYLAVGFDFF
jgi:hypothetical protein